MTRNEQIRKDYKKIKKLAVLARKYNISKQRVEQIVTKRKYIDEKIKIKIIINQECLCGWCEKKLIKNKVNIHHIDCDPKNNKIENLIALCIPCHIKFHNLQRGIYSF